MAETASHVPVWWDLILVVPWLHEPAAGRLSEGVQRWLRSALLVIAALFFFAYPSAESVWSYGGIDINTSGLPLAFLGYVAAVWAVCAIARNVTARPAGLIMLITMFIDWLNIRNGQHIPGVSTGLAPTGGRILLCAFLVAVLAGRFSLSGVASTSTESRG